ncbi:hypothetical protein N7447_010318 [Penicillium robsamsonii]|uniref:uncharacterized protein n=1 Tax=Penicillium robsamsonii TaxID=1792511 RepID=UPI0025496EDB|nr:uncharacterized protein N7447_010318 [Penicillium robsamsonii]KAJ5810802.1 hypothetical protein N7447_010318 [Penicillium robsamsonii]
MIIKLLAGAHETASRGLGGAVQNEIYNMGLDGSIRQLGYKPIQGVFSRKEADEAYGPAQPVPGRNLKWPTVVVEVGVSESSKAAGRCRMVAHELEGRYEACNYRVHQSKDPQHQVRDCCFGPDRQLLAAALRPNDTADHYGIPRRTQTQLTDYHQASSTFDHWV